jgi:hypothetical protein
MPSSKLASVLALTTLAVAVLFVVHAVSGGDLCPWCGVLGR